MTYCAAIRVDAGLVLLSDSRTNAGVDQIGTYSKMHPFGIDGERQLIVLSAGNLATTQDVVAQLERDIRDETERNLLSVADMVEAADYVGELNRAVKEKHNNDPVFDANFIVGGQIGELNPALHLIYPAGNHITTSSATPFLQIGESKYGKPVLDRIITPSVSLDTAALCALVSMESTIRSNLTVGPPVEVAVYERGSLLLNRHYTFDADSDYWKKLMASWDANQRQAFEALPPIEWSKIIDQSD